MIEISLNNIFKSYGFKNVLNGFNLEIKTGDGVSLIGDNGCGKSTILNIINKTECIDSGTISIKNGSTIGYLSQQIDNNYFSKIVKNILYESLEDINKTRELLDKYEDRMTKNPNDMNIINKYLKIQDEFIKLGGYEVDTLIEKISCGLGIKDLMEKDFSNLSGGEQKRVILASIIVKKPDILLLDEPTNHLDISTLEWLEDYLLKFNGTILVVSHDRYFLDKITNKTVLVENGEAIVFHGNYSYYLKENEIRIDREFREYKDQQKMISAMKKKIKQLERFGKLAYPCGEQFFRRAENIRKRLDRLELKDRPQVKKELSINLTFDKRSGNDVLRINNYMLSIGERVLIDDINLTINYGDKISLIGDNGSGKTTLIKKIIKNNDNNIKLGSNIKIGYIPQQIVFDTDMTLLNYSKQYFHDDESRLRSALDKFHFHGESVFKRISKLSGGEKVRLLLFSLIQDNCNFIILDEPTNHIDIFTKETLENALYKYEGTLLFISHDRYFINKLANKILYINNKCINEYLGNYNYFIQHKK